MKNYFHYQLLRADGSTRHGLVALPVDLTTSAVALIERQFDATVLQIHRFPQWIAHAAALARGFSSRAIKPEELGGLLRDLAVMTNSGIPVFDAVKAIAHDEDSTTSTRVARVCRTLLDDLNSGMTLGGAVNRQADVFPETVRSLVTIGDETGTMHNMLMESAAHIDRMISIKANARQALIYPVISFLAIFGAAAFWIVYVMPQLLDMFKQMNAKLPPITIATLAVAGWLGKYWPWALGLWIVFLVGCLIAWRASLRLRLGVITLLHRLPVSRVLLVSSGLAFFSEYLSLLIRSGLDIVSSLRILEAALRNDYYRERVKLMRRHIERGDQVSFAMRQVGGFPTMMVRMISVGEESGTLDAQLQYLSGEYAARLKRSVGMLAELIKPLIIVVAGGVFLFLIVALLLPVYDLVRQTMTIAR